MTDDPYRQWLAERREVSIPSNLADEIMRRVVELEDQQRGIWWLRLVQRIETSRPARLAICGGALAIGSLPFIFLAHVAKFVAI